MSNKKLINQLNQINHNLKKSECQYIVNIFIKTISDAFKKEKNIEIRGFGNWYWKTLKKNYNARNPSTNELIYKPERTKLRFKASKKLNKTINQ